MGLRCLIGHEYGDPQTSRDRHQRGSEVVVTVQEYRECSRCGHRRIISENKEVTAEPPAEPDPEPAAEASWSDPVADAEDTATAIEPDVDAIDEPLSADEDDGIILEDEHEEPGRRYGEWPETDLDEEAVDPEGDHEPWPGEVPESMASSGGPTATSDPFTADQPAAAGSAAAPKPAPTADDAGAIPRAEGPTEPSTSTPTPSPNPRDAELVCPGCGDSWPSVNASLRPGDICPECRSGYLEEQVVQ